MTKIKGTYSATTLIDTINNAISEIEMALLKKSISGVTYDLAEATEAQQEALFELLSTTMAELKAKRQNL